MGETMDARAAPHLDLVSEHARALAWGLVMSVHSYLASLILPGRSNRLAAAATLPCDHCRGGLGLDVHRYCHMQFCSSACVAAYQQRLTVETRVKICRLDVLRSETTALHVTVDQQIISAEHTVRTVVLPTNGSRKTGGYANWKTRRVAAIIE
jgi:hypothetical protein